MITIEEKAGEESSYPLEITLKDHDGVEIEASAITSIKWSLSDVFGNIINSRQDVNVTSIVNPVTIIPSGDDLATTDNDADNQYKRRFTVKYIYNSEFANNQPKNEEAEFQIDPFINVPALP